MPPLVKYYYVKHKIDKNWLGTVMPQLVPRHNWSPWTICGKLCCRSWSPVPSMAAMDGPLCRKWSLSSKLEKQRWQILTDEVTIKKLLQCLLQ